MVEVKLDFEILIDYEVDEEEEVHKDSIEVVSELFENLHQVMKLIVGKWCLCWFFLITLFFLSFFFPQYFMFFLIANVDYHLQRHECINTV